MILSPKFVVSKRILGHIDGFPLSEKQIQCNGIDVRIRNVYSLGGSIEVNDFSEKKIDETYFYKTKVLLDDFGFYTLEKGIPYSVDCFETVNIPENVSAMIYGRSTFNRRGIFMRSSLYDSGFCNVVGFTMYPWVDCRIRVRSRVAQIVFFRSDSHNLYDGQYQKR